MSTHALHLMQMHHATLDRLDAVDELYRQLDTMIRELPAGVRMPTTIAQLLTLMGGDEAADASGSITQVEDLPF